MKLVNALMGASFLSGDELHQIAYLLNWKFTPEEMEEYRTEFKNCYEVVSDRIKKMKMFKTPEHLMENHDEYLKYKHQTLVGLRGIARELNKTKEENEHKYKLGDLHP